MADDQENPSTGSSMSPEKDCISDVSVENSLIGHQQIMSMNISPLLNTPVTDMVGLMGHHQHFGRCAKFEMRMMECMEAYGSDMSKVKCKDLIDDFDECHTQKKQIARETAMRMERHKQVLRGERKLKDHYAPPPHHDSY